MGKGGSMTKDWMIVLLMGLLMLSVGLAAILGPKNACPESDFLGYSGMIVLYPGTYVIEEPLIITGSGEGNTLTFGVPLPEPTPIPTPTVSPTPISTPTVTPTPTPQFTGIRLYVENNRYAYSSCTEAYLVKAIGQEICTSEISYGHDSISVPGQTIESTGMVYRKASGSSFELVYMSGLRNYFLTEQEYVSFCIEARLEFD